MRGCQCRLQPRRRPRQPGRSLRAALRRQPSLQTSRSEGAPAGASSARLWRQGSRFQPLCRLKSFAFLRVPPGYYDLSLEGRRACLGAASVEHLCKTLVLKNQRHKLVPGLAAGLNPQHFCVIIQAGLCSVQLGTTALSPHLLLAGQPAGPHRDIPCAAQYAARLDEDKLRKVLWGQCGEGRVGLKHFSVRMASPGQALELTGYGHGAVTPFAMPADLPVYLSNQIPRLEPRTFWLGGGEQDLKLQLDTAEFLAACAPAVVDITHPSDCQLVGEPDM